jgi:hypothetical protein
LSGIEVLVDAIEKVNPNQVTFFCPRFSIGFLWKLVDELSLYRRRNLKEFNLYILNFNSEEELIFSLNECIEIQDFFSNINIYQIQVDKTESFKKLLPGFLYLNGTSQKAYSFQADFSLLGFQNEKLLVSSSVSKVLNALHVLSEESLKIDRIYLNKIEKNKTLQLVTPAEVSITSNIPDFKLLFLSSRTGKIHNAGAGLNWGQPTATRNRKDLNAAYIAVPTDLQKSELLPAVNEKFVCIFDDGVEIEMVRTGSNGKNLTSAYENQFFGRYIRFKLSIAPGQLITQSHLELANIYGINFYKLALQKYLGKFIRE